MTITSPRILMDGSVLRVLTSIAYLNAQFLTALADCARNRPQQFPLPFCLQADFSRLTPTECHERATHGVCLADARFGDPLEWTRARTVPSADSAHAGEHWLAPQPSRWIAHSVLLTGWHVVHSAPSLVRVLLGMSEEVAQEIQQLPVTDLARIVETRSSWVRPRWLDRADLWSSILAARTRSHPQPSTQLRVLQAAATESSRMVSSAAYGAAQELSQECADATRSAALPSKRAQPRSERSPRRRR